MPDRPPSAVSAFTAVGLCLILAVGVVAIVQRDLPVVFLVIWCVALAAAIGFNVWAARGSRRR